MGKNPYGLNLNARKSGCLRLARALFVGALPASADSIYDAKVEQKLTDLNPDQKAKVRPLPSRPRQR